mgnify:CR=1 FL=1
MKNKKDDDKKDDDKKDDDKKDDDKKKDDNKRMGKEYDNTDQINNRTEKRRYNVSTWQ